MTTWKELSETDAWRYCEGELSLEHSFELIDVKLCQAEIPAGMSQPLIRAHFEALDIPLSRGMVRWLSYVLKRAHGRTPEQRIAQWFQSLELYSILTHTAAFLVGVLVAIAWFYHVLNAAGIGNVFDNFLTAWGLR